MSQMFVKKYLHMKSCILTVTPRIYHHMVNLRFCSTGRVNVKNGL